MRTVIFLPWLTALLAAAIPGSSGEAQLPQIGVSYVSNSPLDVVVVAHQDDWQLFMGDIIARQIRSGKRVVFIYLTAGDDGRERLYWETRERGAPICACCSWFGSYRFNCEPLFDGKHAQA